MSLFIHIGQLKTASTFLQKEYFKKLHAEKLTVYNPPEIMTKINLLIMNPAEEDSDPFLRDIMIDIVDLLKVYKKNTHL